MPIDDSSGTNKRARYTPDIIPSFNYVASVNSVSTFNKTSDNIHVIVLTYDAPETDHITMRDKPGHAMEKIGYYYRRHGAIRCYINIGSIATTVLLIRAFITVMELLE